MADAGGIITSCINRPKTFATRWYWHDGAPNATICSRCHEDHIRQTWLASHLRTAWCSDGKPRACVFSKPWIRDELFPKVISTGNLPPLLDFMNARLKIPDCKELGGVEFDAGFRWYRPKFNAIPGMAVCEGCFEDQIMARHFSVHFEPAQQGPNEIWTCDFAIRFVSEEYHRRAGIDDWKEFCREVGSRLGIPPCPGEGMVQAKSRAWFAPVNGPQGCLFCFACYCDHIVSTTEEPQWHLVTHDEVVRAFGTNISCSRAQLNLSIVVALAGEKKDVSVFTTALRRMSKEPFCGSDGIANAQWYTFTSNPAKFGICGACYAAIAQPLNIARFLVPKSGGPPGTKLLCSLNTAHPRVQKFVDKVIDTWLSGDFRPFEECARAYSQMPPCPRANKVGNRSWFGWQECKICPECHHDHCRGTTLASQMKLKGEMLSEQTMCEMYSPRMRDLYETACEASPPNTRRLFSKTLERRQVFEETVPREKQILSEMQQRISQHQGLVSMSAVYGTMGGAMHPVADSHPYGASNINYGYSVQGGVHGAQASVIMAGLQEDERTVKELESRWKSVE